MFSALLSTPRYLLSASLLLLGQITADAAIGLSPVASSPYDLAISGLLENVPSGETRFIAWADLMKLPTSKLRLEGEFVPGEQEVTVVYVSDLWAALPLKEGADVLLATCTDGYASVYKREFINAYRPFVVLEINGRGPEHWPPAGLAFNPGPYVISVSPVVVPAVASLVDASHKRPWGVSRIEVVNYAERFAPLYAGALTQPSAQVADGREIWVNSCYSCHHGPVAGLGGTKSDRPFQVLTAYAKYNPSYLKAYVLDPQKVMSGAKMAAHPHYSDAQLDALIAFLKLLSP